MSCTRQWMHQHHVHLPMYCGHCNIPNFQFGMLYIRSSCISYFILPLVLILENPKQLKDPRRELGISYLHIWVFSNFVNRIIWFYLFYHQLFLLQKYERGNKMTFPKYRNIEDLIKKSNKFYFGVFRYFYLNLGKMHIFQSCNLGPDKCSLYRAWF